MSESNVISVVLADPTNSNPDQPFDRLMIFDKSTGLPIDAESILSPGSSGVEVQDANGDPVTLGLPAGQKLVIKLDAAGEVDDLVMESVT